MTKTSLTATMTKIHDLLESLSSEERHKVVASALALLGDASTASPVGGAAGGAGSADDPSGGMNGIGPKAQRWMKQHNVTQEDIEQVFHVEKDDVEVIAPSIPGKTRREQTANVYILSGARALLATDSAAFDDADAVSLCKHIGCYDTNNHTANRRSTGNCMSGDRKKGFVLPAPGLKAAAELVRQLASPGKA